MEGLPEGVEAVRYGETREGDFILVGSLVCGPAGEHYSGCGLIVQPAPGYTFHQDVATNSQIPVRQYQEPKRIQATFTVTDDYQERKLRAGLKRLPGLRVVEAAA